MPPSKTGPKNPTGPKIQAVCPAHGRFLWPRTKDGPFTCAWMVCEKHDAYFSDIGQACPSCTKGYAVHLAARCEEKITIAGRGETKGITLDCADRAGLEEVLEASNATSSALWMRALVRRFIEHGRDSAEQIICRTLRSAEPGMPHWSDAQLLGLAEKVVKELSR